MKSHRSRRVLCRSPAPHQRLTVFRDYTLFSGSRAPAHWDGDGGLRREMAREEAEEQLHGSELLAAVASGMVALQKQYAGKGPSKCKAYWAGQDTLVIMFGGGS